MDKPIKLQLQNNNLSKYETNAFDTYLDMLTLFILYLKHQFRYLQHAMH